MANDFHTIQVGVDTVPTPDTPRLGVAISYTTNKRGSADMDVYSLAAYSLGMNVNGQFVDVVARLGSAKTDMTFDGDKKGSMDNIVTALSGEFGCRFDLAKSVYIEPQVELAYTHVDADDLSLSNGSTYRFDNANSLMGRAGLALGLQCPENDNTAYLRMSAFHEFLGDSAVTGSNGTVYELTSLPSGHIAFRYPFWTTNSEQHIFNILFRKNIKSYAKMLHTLPIGIATQLF